MLKTPEKFVRDIAASAKTIQMDIDCSDLLTSGKQNTSGVYMITTRRTRAKIMVYCDMETSGGGWTDIDRDQNQFSSCASSHQGGWWYNNCYSKNLNGKYVEPGTKGMHEGIIDLSFERADGESLKKTKMMIRRSF
ncbi:ANGL1-like protein [Mya arenaria]|uniref:ANGL1-like protein n=1 Tax=Mya arenaria TaxID=6604 RepID=A0ABY7GAE7_MYAAR|nr:ANGL1-like protein [Mya arenaria]